ncbi:MAG: glycosyltransferase family A protein [Candidatus Paceibacterota bacterium]|jgi:glycosyltransferase involved in cell wall biosynthesis
MIKASIIITCYNKERYISRAINSCISQNFPHDQYEIIIVDDASTDKSRDAISLYHGFEGYHFIRTRFLKKNKGQAHASNVGMAMAKGRYIVRVDGDDYVHENFLKVMTETLEWNADIGFVYCDLIVVTGSGAPDQRKFELNTFERLLNHGAGVVFRKEYLKKLGGYDETLRNCEDYDLLLRYQKKYPGYHVRLPYYRYFKEGSALSTEHAERKRLKKIIRVRNGHKH